MALKLTGDPRRDFEKVAAENIQLRERIMGYQEKIAGLRQSLKSANASEASQKDYYEEQLAEKDTIIKELKNRLEHELALKGHDGTNTGTPTSLTPANRKKVIPNSRRSSGSLE